jgi:glycine dehydrogenase subunit 1
VRYTPAGKKDREAMLACIGAEDVASLYGDIPECVRMEGGLKLPGGVSEQELVRRMRSLSGENLARTSFLGAGCYQHYIPSAVRHAISRSELYTSYTPYQAEISQGVLQALFEYQSLMCELTGQEVSNATMYDGSTALAEACVMAHNITGRTEIIASDTLHPQYRQVLGTYCEAGGLSLKVVPSADGSSGNLEPTAETAAVIVQTPNFFGNIEYTAPLHEMAREAGALLIGCVAEATSLGLVKPPSADIVAGDGQSLGNPMSFGGPAFGFLTTAMKYARNLPGRLVGETTDAQGRRGYVLTLQAREQHIRREKASSNICTAQSLCGIAAAAYLSLLGPEGFRRVAENSRSNALYLSRRLAGLKGFSLAFERPFYDEFLMRCPKGTYEKAMKAGIIPGLLVQAHYPKLKDCMLFCATEAHSKSDMDALVEALT